MARILGRKGEKVQYGGEEMTVRSALDLSTLILIDSNGDHHHASLSELEKEARGIPRDAINHDDIRASKVEPWVKACAHLLDDERHTKAEVALAAKELGVSVATVYRALERWRLSGETKDLPPPTRPGGRGKSRLLPAIEAIIQEQLDRVLRKGGISKRKFLKDCRRAIDKAGFEVSPGTLRDRLASVPAYKFMKTRKGRDAVAREMDPIKGPYPTFHGLFRRFRSTIGRSTWRWCPMIAPALSAGHGQQSESASGAGWCSDSTSASTIQEMCLSG
jgi:hypothetical protein